MTRATDQAVKIIKEKYGEDAVMRLGDTVNIPIDVIPTGILGIDLAIGVGGIPRGRITEIFGPPTSGKTSLSLHTIAEAQKMGLGCAYIDAENALDVTYANALGVNVGELFISQPSSGEEGLSIAEIWMMTGDIGIVVIDSVDALVPQAIIDGEFGDQRPGLHAKMMSQAMRKLSSITRRSNASLLFINQIRKNIMQTYGPTEFTPGGSALPYYSSLRIDIRRASALKDNDDGQVGNRTKIKIVKNKVSAPFKEREVDIIFGKGIDKIADIFEIAIECDVINKSGSWYSYSSERIGQGKVASLAFLNENTEILQRIRESVLKKESKVHE